ncbi:MULTISPECIES: hypothetical protein [Providencia]|jgi:hypothetical protein|uniref:hypothetical protein n=1 Tax=Providencia TaxID=586 RepID=UPI0012B5CFE6|nr:MULTISPECIES: hypothetical protein [Providencia]MDR2224654.1 hypothetical protein [Providencia sp.]MTC72312.1 hypothetical protein [Providencia sp. wls1914]
MENYSLIGIHDLSRVFIANPVLGINYVVNVSLSVNGITTIIGLDAISHDIKNKTLSEIREIAYSEFLKGLPSTSK